MHHVLLSHHNEHLTPTSLREDLSDVHSQPAPFSKNIKPERFKPISGGTEGYLVVRQDCPLHLLPQRGAKNQERLAGRHLTF